VNVDVRWRQRFQNLERAVVLLHEPFAGDIAALSPLEREGTIQRFEVAVELAWKTLKDYLEHQGQTLQPVTPRNVVKEAFRAGLLTDGQVWIDMLDHRNLLAHTYDASQVERAVVAIRDHYLTAFDALRAWLAAQVAA